MIKTILSLDYLNKCCYYGYKTIISMILDLRKNFRFFLIFIFPDYKKKYCTF